MRDDQDNGGRDDGSIWTSYSDMFTTMAIIFLVMFVFAMIKLGVSSLEKLAAQKKHKEEMQGLISDKEKRQNQKKISQIKDTLDEAKIYKDVIKDKIEQLQDFASKIDKNERIMKDLVVDQEKKTALLNKVSEELQDRQRELDAAFHANKNLDQQLKSARTDIINNKKKILVLESSLNEKIKNIQNLKSGLEYIKEQKLAKEKRILELDQLINEEKHNKKLLKSEIANYRSERNMLKSDIERLKEVVDTKDHKIQDLNEMALEYRKQIEESMQKSRELMNQIMDKESAIAAAKVREEGLKSEFQRLDDTTKELNTEITSLEKNKMLLDQQLQGLKEQHAELQISYNNSITKNKELNQEISGLKNELIDKTSDISKFQHIVADLKGKNASMDEALKSLQEKNLELVGQNKQLETKSRSLETLVKQMGGQDQGLETRNRQLASVNQKIKHDLQDLNSKLVSCEEEKMKLAGDQEKISKDVQYVKKKVKQANANLRTSLAKKLAAKFKDANIDVFVDLKTGTISLMTGNNLLFKRNSHRLNRRAKKLLKKLIPLYAEVLFEDPKIAKKISSFNIDGHASPTYRGRYVSPKKHNHKAYSYNLDLSGRRATSIAKYVFGDDTQTFKHKNKLRILTKSTGYGYSAPRLKVKKKGKRLASRNDDCGPYDCSLSQRVELGFTLEDDLETINKIMELKARK